MSLQGCGRKLGPYPCCSVIQGDCLELMKSLPDGCVDAVITSPPYNVGMPYVGFHDDVPWPEYYKMLSGVAVAALGNLKDGGILAVNLPKEVRIRRDHPDFEFRRVEKVGEKFDLMCEPIGFKPRESIVWVKGGLGNPISTTFAMGADNNIYVRPTCELICLHSKGRYFYDGGTGRRGRKDVPFLEETKDVWEIVPSRNNGHPATFPEEIPTRLIRMFTLNRKHEPVILDPFLGSGTTAVAAKKLGRHFLGFEISPEYCRIAEERIALVEMQPQLFERMPEQMELGK